MTDLQCFDQFIDRCMSVDIILVSELYIETFRQVGMHEEIGLRRVVARREDSAGSEECATRNVLFQISLSDCDVIIKIVYEAKRHSRRLNPLQS